MLNPTGCMYQYILETLTFSSKSIKFAIILVFSYNVLNFFIASSIMSKGKQQRYIITIRKVQSDFNKVTAKGNGHLPIAMASVGDQRPRLVGMPCY